MEPATPQPLPAEIRVEQLAPDEVRYVLPRRPLGNYRWLAVLPLVFGLVGLSFAWEWFAPLVQMPMQGVSLIFGAVGALFAGSAIIVPIAIAAAMLWGHSSIEIRGGQLWGIEHVGPFRWGRKRPLAQVRRLLVEGPTDKRSSLASGASLPSGFAAIRIETERGKPRLAAIGYPREWLVPLAHELARQVRAAASDVSSPLTFGMPQANTVEVADDRDPIQRFIQPAGSRIVMTEGPDNLTFEVPPAGVSGGVSGLLVFACVWLAFSTLIGYSMVFGQGQPAGGNNLWLVAVAMVAFWAIGLGLLLAAVHMARRRAAIAVAGGRCLIAQFGLFGETKHVWEAGELLTVQVGPSGAEVNDKPVMELQFIPRAGDKIGVLSARDEAELEWLATRLTQALELPPARAESTIAGDVADKPPKSNAVCQQMPGAMTISIPRSRLVGLPLYYWIFAAFWNGITLAAGSALVAGARNGGGDLAPLVFVATFGLIGVALIGGAIHLTIRRAEIAFASGRLLVLQFGLFGKRRNEWAAEELAAVRAAPSDTSVGKRRLLQLQIVPTSGKAITLLTGRDDDELAWIATQLRHATKLPAETQAERELQSSKVAAG